MLTNQQSNLLSKFINILLKPGYYYHHSLDDSYIESDGLLQLSKLLLETTLSGKEELVNLVNWMNIEENKRLVITHKGGSINIALYEDKSPNGFGDFHHRDFNSVAYEFIQELNRYVINRTFTNKKDWD